MTHIPEMPEDWEPEIVVIGKNGKYELGFVLNNLLLKDTTDLIQTLNALKQALWQAPHDYKLRAMLGVDEEGQGTWHIH